MSDRHAPARGEDVLELPAELRPYLHPRRGGSAGAPVEVDASAAVWIRALVDEAFPGPGSVPDRLAGDAERVERARAHLAGETSPAGAAAVTLAAWTRPTADPARGEGVRLYPDDAAQSAFADAWVAEHGVAFAACALVELSTVTTAWAGFPPSRVRILPGEDVRLGWETGRRMRTLLAEAADDDHRDAVERLAAHRGTQAQKAVASYLIPTRQDWLDECHEPYGRESPRWWLLRHAYSTPRQLAKDGLLFRDDCPMSLLVTLADAAAADAVPLFARTLDEGHVDAAERRRLLEVLGLIPADEAFRALVERIDEKYVRPVLIAAMARYPARALRRLAEAGVTEPLAEHVRAHPEVAAAVLPALPDDARATVEKAVAADVRLPEANTGDLPRLLVEPPWTRRRKAPKAVVVTGLAPPAEQRMTWAEGEREAWSVLALPSGARPYPAGGDWSAVAAAYRAGRVRWDVLVAQGPPEIVRPMLAERHDPHFFWNADDVSWMKSVVGRYGFDALPLLMTAVRSNPGTCARVLLPYLNAEVATLMAEWLAQRKTARHAAITWFGRHGAGAARMLFPAALGKAGKARKQAEGALRLLAARHGAEEIAAAARDLGPEAAGAIEALLAADPLDILPARAPAVGDWADAGALPQILLRGRGRALPATAAGHVITMLAMSRPGEAYAGLDVVRELCDRRSLAEFGWALFERWERHGAPAKDGWALEQLGVLGDDGTVRALAAAVRAWPGDAHHRRAVTELDVFAAIGTDLALMHLHALAGHVRSTGLRARAKDKIEEIAAARGLTPERLADRFVPDFGLDPDGSMTLDYGPRRFTVGFDEALQPFAVDGDGRRRTTLPKPAAGDDPDLAPAAHRRFSSMRKVAREASAEQVRRLEAAMVAGRGWTAGEFRALFVDHPLVWHIARRLVWLAGDAFRVAEDRTFADVRDEPFTLPGTATVRIAHPLDLGDDLAAWRTLLGDYEILQPFPQLERPTYALSAEERASARLARFEGLKVRTTRVLALSHRGWDRGTPGGVSRVLPGARHVVVDLNPGLHFDGGDLVPEQVIEAVRLTDHTFAETAGLTFGDLPPAAASEVLAALTTLQPGGTP
ncbi:DUF4132 domain-containing protein [Actinomadura rugatobispora]|uniref:DUF4132 domain-containing protein n=1 Tax=Actinomadura rugatobispora TaxID=1994 RepID=A0ABW1AE16_9ACTN|nr:hypothetical protein GCM10010200_087920 [Actinomadura rugatobispora]